MPTPPSLLCTLPENATELDPASLAERYPFLPPADLWDLPDWLARANFGFLPAPVVVTLADWRSAPTFAAFVNLTPR